jgi:hypothetical protein
VDPELLRQIDSAFQGAEGSAGQPAGDPRVLMDRMEELRAEMEAARI